MGGVIEKLPGAIVLMPQQLKELSGEECKRRLSVEGKEATTSMGDEEARLALERALGERYCSLFLPAMALAICGYAALAATLPSDGKALAALAVLPAPMILTVGGLRKPKTQDS
mmetsp:Transcript_54718/g.97608  ORF Transcript_54718/g.97608 Transcript_54718/m.97608 type:complete len:114 (-) Transcript_54718:43-384(-)